MTERESSSSLAWLDFDEETRRSMQEHLSLLTEPNTVDELGIGQIRDVFSGIFFPGTSTLWRRARYTLFVPWIYRDLELHGTRGAAGAEAARRAQARLIRALKRGDDHEGLIGRYKDEPMRMPDELVWNGLRTLGIRRREGSLGKYRRMLERGDAGRFELVRGEVGEAVDAESGSWWHEAMPPAPDDLFEQTDFDLSWPEADFLRSRFEATHHGTLMTELLAEPASTDLEAKWPWEARGALKRADAETQEAAAHARVFSYGVQGAGLLYSHLVAVARESHDLAQKLADDLATWKGRLRSDRVASEILNWRGRREAFWALVTGENPNLRSGTVEFVDRWIEVAKLPTEELLSSKEAHGLIREREWDVKRHLARLSERAALDRARAEAGTGQLDFRWYQACSIATDICHGLSAEPV